MDAVSFIDIGQFILPVSCEFWHILSFKYWVHFISVSHLVSILMVFCYYPFCVVVFCNDSPFFISDIVSFFLSQPRWMFINFYRSFQRTSIWFQSRPSLLTYYCTTSLPFALVFIISFLMLSFYLLCSPLPPTSPPQFPRLEDQTIDFRLSSFLLHADSAINSL